MSNNKDNKKNILDFDVGKNQSSIFGNSNSGYQNIDSGSHDSTIVGPETLFFGISPQSRRQCQSVFNIVFAVISIIALILILTSTGLWIRKEYGVIFTSRYNVTASRNVKRIDMSDPVLSDDEEEVVAQFSMVNTYEYTTVGAILASNKPISGYRNDSDGHLSLWTSDQGILNKAIHIDNKQRIGINNNNPQEVLDINGKAISNVGFMTVSDRNLKYDIKDISEDVSINILRNVKPKIFKRKSNVPPYRKYSTKYLGFIAQDFEELDQQYVTTSNVLSDIRHIDTTAVLAHLWNTIRHLDEKINNLQESLNNCKKLN